MFLTKAVRDWGRTGFYEADGYFIGGPAPWMTQESVFAESTESVGVESESAQVAICIEIDGFYIKNDGFCI